MTELKKNLVLMVGFFSKFSTPGIIKSDTSSSASRSIALG